MSTMDHAHIFSEHKQFACGSCKEESQLGACEFTGENSLGRAWLQGSPKYRMSSFIFQTSYHVIFFSCLFVSLVSFISERFVHIVPSVHFVSFGSCHSDTKGSAWLIWSFAHSFSVFSFWHIFQNPHVFFWTFYSGIPTIYFQNPMCFFGHSILAFWPFIFWYSVWDFAVILLILYLCYDPIIPNIVHYIILRILFVCIHFQFPAFRP